MTRKGWLLFIAMSVFWGIPYLFIKIALRELDPTVVVFARVGIAALVLLPVAARRGTLRPLRGRWLMLAALSLVQIVGPFGPGWISAGRPILACTSCSVACPGTSV